MIGESFVQGTATPLPVALDVTSSGVPLDQTETADTSEAMETMVEDPLGGNPPSNVDALPKFE